MKKGNNIQTKVIGKLLIERGALREEQVGKLLTIQERDLRIGVRSKLGELAVRSGWANAERVTDALSQQAAAIIENGGLGDVLVALDALDEEGLTIAKKLEKEKSLPIEEVLVDGGCCTQEQVRMGTQLLNLRKNAAARNRTSSTFSPYNIMELLVHEQINDVLRSDGKCTCSQCWSNLGALALNELPPRYVSEHGRIIDFLPRFRSEYEKIVQRKLQDALTRVRVNPKTSCLSRFPDELLMRREAETVLHEVMVRISNRHVHLCQRDLDALFGQGYQLRKAKDLIQPGQFAAEETVTLAGPKGMIERVRVLGPVRPRTQVEISGTDQFILGVRAPVRESGQIEGTPGIELRGPENAVSIESGVIRALRHVHMTPDDAERVGVQNGGMVSVRLTGDRSMICEGVLIRVSRSARLEMHIDMDEANAAGLAAESVGQILIPVMTV